MRGPYFTLYQQIAQRKLKSRQALVQDVSDTVRTQQPCSIVPGSDGEAVMEATKIAVIACFAGRAFEIPMFEARCRARCIWSFGRILETREGCKRC